MTSDQPDDGLVDDSPTVGVLHPGQMGSTIAATAAQRVSVVAAGDDRSAATVTRMKQAGLTDVGTPEQLCSIADIVISICPPGAAIDVAESVAATGFDGIYLDANAISPATSAAVGSRFDRFVDGGVIGPPAVGPGTTRMYLSGPHAAEVAPIWDGSALDVRVLHSPDGGHADNGAASALKMAYAGWTKGQAALLLNINALAESAGIAEALRAEWDISQPGLVERSDSVAGSTSAKAWRFAGEMNEIAATMAEAGLPSGFHLGATELYRRLAKFKDQPGSPLNVVLEEILAARSDEPAGP